jgi:hypothetical protein
MYSLFYLYVIFAREIITTNETSSLKSCTLKNTAHFRCCYIEEKTIKRWRKIKIERLLNALLFISFTSIS